MGNSNNAAGEINAKDVITYHIFSDGKIEKHIPKEIKKEYLKKYKYVYHDKNNIEHEICVVDFTLAEKRENGKHDLCNLPKKKITTKRTFKKMKTGR